MDGNNLVSILAIRPNILYPNVFHIKFSFYILYSLMKTLLCGHNAKGHYFDKNVIAVVFLKHLD